MRKAGESSLTEHERIQLISLDKSVNFVIFVFSNYF